MADLTDFIKEVKQANDIVDVIGSYLELRHAGSSFLARCPFHGEKTPSFNVNRNMQFYHCFGCGESGDVIGFVQKFESCTFMEALEILAKRANIKMPEIASDKRNEALSAERKKRDTYLAIMREAAVFYYTMFKTERGSVARRYMEKRGFDAETLKKFGVGYSPDMYSLPNYLKQKGFDTADCLKCGVLQKKADGTPFDALSGRLIIPIFNMAGKVIAFGGRGLDEKTIAFGKYKNTSETPLFLKKDNLYNLNIAKEQKQQAALPNIVVVEGYMDVIAMYQAGFKRCVASMGTSLTENQAKLLSRLTDTVYICYDGDSAGQKATVRGLDILDKAGLEVRVMSVPREGDVKDPDEFIKKYGAEAFEKLIEAALPLADYKLKLLDDAFDINSADPAVRNDALPKYVKGATVLLSQLDDARQAQYLRAVSLKTGYSEEYFRRKLESNVEEALPSADVLSAEEKAKYFIAACMLGNADFARLEEKPLCHSAFLEKLFDYIFQCRKNGEAPSTDMMFTVCPDADKQCYENILGVDLSDQAYEKNKAYFEECKALVIAEALKYKRDVLIKKLKNDDGDAAELMKEISLINDRINSLK